MIIQKLQSILILQYCYNLLCKRSLKQKTLPSNHLNFANSYNNTGAIYSKKGKYDEALK